MNYLDQAKFNVKEMEKGDKIFGISILLGVIFVIVLAFISLMVLISKFFNYIV